MRSGYWVRFVIVVLCAAFSFGGTFVCRSSTHDNVPPPAPARPNPASAQPGTPAWILQEMIVRAVAR
jgi:hypothetical protein